MRKSNLSFLLLFISCGLWSQCDMSFQYHVTIDVDNTANAQTYNNHQLLVVINTMDLINQGKMNADGSDIRFYDDVCTPLCHSIESGLNTTSTSIWVKVTSIPASSTVSITMQYGNAVATSVEDGECTFDFYEDFNDNTFNLVNSCGNVSITSDGAYGMVSWTSNGIAYSNHDFAMENVYTAEAMVMGISGNWPGIHMMNTTIKKYSLLASGSQEDVRISFDINSGTSACVSQSWATSEIPYTSPDGIWSLTWVGTGDIRANFPTVGDISTTNNLRPLNSSLAVGIGGISSGTGNFMEVDWLRVRRFSENDIPTTLGQENGGAPIPTMSFWGILILGIFLTIVSVASFKSMEYSFN